MARVGRFGRNRRLGSSNLTMIVANLIREQRQAEDSAAYDAWKNGGDFQGKPMTDDRYLSYIAARRDGFSKDDPLWDQWNNSYIQTKFGTEESKIGLRFKEGKASAGDVANWYKSQLKGLDPNSEFYRTVAGRAADWAKSAAASARASAKKAATDALVKQYKDAGAVIADTDALEAALLVQIHRTPGNNTIESLTDASATSLEEFFASGVVVNGKVITLEDWRRAAVHRYNAYTQQIKAGKKAGWDVSSEIKKKSGALDSLTNINAIDDRSKYETLRNEWDSALRDANGDPEAVKAANQAYLAGLQKLLQTASSTTGNATNNASFIGALSTEINALQGQDTGAGQTVASMWGIGGARSDDASNTASGVQLVNQDAASLQNGTAYLVYDPSSKGSSGSATISVAFYSDFNPATDTSYAPSFQRGSDGKVRKVYLAGTAVTSGYVSAPDGTPVPVSEVGGNLSTLLQQGWKLTSTEYTLGYVFTNPDGSKSYGILDPSGKVTYTDTNPWKTTVGGVAIGDPTIQPDGVTVDPTTTLSTTTNGLEGSLPTGSTPGTTGGAPVVTGAGVTVSDAMRALNPNFVPHDAAIAAELGNAQSGVGGAHLVAGGSESTSGYTQQGSGTGAASVAQATLSSVLRIIQGGLSTWTSTPPGPLDVPGSFPGIDQPGGSYQTVMPWTGAGINQPQNTGTWNPNGSRTWNAPPLPPSTAGQLPTGKPSLLTPPKPVLPSSIPPKPVDYLPPTAPGNAGSRTKF